MSGHIEIVKHDGFQDCGNIISISGDKMQSICIKSIPHKEQRYETCGDWFDDENGVTQIRVCDIGNPDFELSVSLHEVIEQYLCKIAGITDEEVTAFDDKWQKENPKNTDDEPGDLPKAPYYKQHKVAVAIEDIFLKACMEERYNKTFRDHLKKEKSL